MNLEFILSYPLNTLNEALQIHSCPVYPPNLYSILSLFIGNLSLFPPSFPSVLKKNQSMKKQQLEQENKEGVHCSDC